jgi:hypothetical protein
MSTEQETPQSTQPKRPGLTEGVMTEFTVFTKIKPEEADALREDLSAMSGEAGARDAMEQIGTLHSARHVMFDNGTRHMFASVFDGSWDSYIDDFAKTAVGERFERVFRHTEGFPGIKDPNVKDWFAAQQQTAGVFATAYPDLTVQQIWKDQRVNQAFQEVLDTPEFRAALDNPALAELMATPAFQKLLNEAQG